MIAENVLKLEQNYIRIQEENARLQRALGEDLARSMDCEHCSYYLQHYIRSGTLYVKTYSGHCVHGRNKNRKPDEKGCKYFEAKK